MAALAKKSTSLSAFDYNAIWSTFKDEVRRA